MPGSAKLQDPANSKDPTPHRSERPLAYRIWEKHYASATASAAFPPEPTPTKAQGSRK